MPSNLTVAEGSTVVLDENPSAEIAEGLQTVQLNTLNDLVEHGVIGSRDTVETLLSSAKDATRTALTNRSTFVPFVPVPGTARPDLRRLGTFSAATPGVNPTEREAFWRVARDIDPHALANVEPDSNLHTVLSPSARVRLTSIINYLFRDITVKSNGTLTVAASVQQLTCGDLVIERGGRIVVQGSGLSIKAFSIRGNSLPGIDVIQPIHPIHQ